MTINFSSLTSFSQKIAKQAGHILKKGLQEPLLIDRKSTVTDIVTNCDKESENFIVKSILDYYPSSGILSEEEGWIGDSHSSLKWIIDPLDGTLNFSHGYPIFCVSIAACIDEDLFCGVIYNPVSNEFFVAEKGAGAFLNNRPISISAVRDLPSSLLAVGLPYFGVLRNKDYLERFTHILFEGYPIRRSGSAALDLAYLACGRLDGYWSDNLNPWDYAAASIILTEAGGKISNFQGHKPDLFTPSSILATNPFITKDLAKALKL
ncbi:MAG: inositol monophosphatase family protein [Rhabdochlamydiaceae bacterium]